MTRRPTSLQRLLEAAAEPTYARIRRDRDRVDEPLRAILRVLLQDLFDPGLDATRLFHRAGVRGHHIVGVFRRELRTSPRQYLEDRRMETACRLLAVTPLTVSEIVPLLGFGEPTAFSRAFLRWSGVRPTTYRKRERSLRALRPADSPEDVLTLRSALLGEATPEAATALVERLVDHYPEAREVLTAPAHPSCCGA